MIPARLLCLAFALVFSSTAQAETAIYGTGTYEAFGFTGSNYSSGGSFKKATGGVNGGVFFTFPTESRFKASIDGRILYGAGKNGGQAYTGAFRVSFVPQHNRLRPYFQIGGGVASTQLTSPICSGFSCSIQQRRVSNGVAQLAFGIDVRATDHMDIRAFDYGADAGSGTGAAHAAAGFLDAGLVYHFH
ncbi:MAG TPA: hypothetical protein VM865_00730 [Acidobacteriaceae bacterium]|jgi:hypothetical protein|nr:hypothetical protein [Acidobacteriaceae bacterium]